MNDVDLLGALLAQLEQDRIAGQTRAAILQKICLRLHEEREGYDWVGFYLADGERPELVLGPYVGAPTEHTRIPFGRGICGQVASSCETMVVPDVAATANYLACSMDVKSEIVVPILVAGHFVAQIDIDSHGPNRFSHQDRVLLETLATALAPYFA